jgi:hypothetical protein
MAYSTVQILPTTRLARGNLLHHGAQGIEMLSDDITLRDA